MSFKVPSVSELPEILKTIESKWKIKLMRRFDRERYVASKEENRNTKLPRYILSMFPYPSGRLHLGHVRIYTSGDILARYSRLLAKNEKHQLDFSHVIYPMGFDSFGLPAENAARERGLNPHNWTNSNIRTMKQQLDDLGLQFDWREATSNPNFYKWTQEIFLRLMDSGLAYKSFAKVNWDPVDETVLADEQVDDQGRSWRSGAFVEKRYFRQWFLKVNAFTNDIYNAHDINPESWRDVLAIQRNWIGKPKGWMFYLPFTSENFTETDTISVFTRSPELFIRPQTKLIISSDHWLEKVYKISQKGFIQNPFTGDQLQVEITDKLQSLPENCKATLINCSFEIEQDDHDTQSINISRDQILLRAKMAGLGGYFTSDKYRDWLISRQRFWGTPIPVVKCDSCGYRGVDRSLLPVTLPKIDDFGAMWTKGKNDYVLGDHEIVSPIANLAPSEWISTKCPSCDSVSRRECETFDTLFDSSWYFLRYATSPLKDQPYDPERVQPVWCYIGGIEHASMHLFYARFITHFLHSIGKLNFKEPFTKLLVQGVVKSQTYKLNGKYITAKEASEENFNKSDLVVEYEKMSKSKGNGVDPQELIDTYGIDATRFCLMSYANPRTERLWRSTQEEFKDVMIYFRRLILTMHDYMEVGESLRKNPNDQSKSLKITELDAESLELARKSLVETRNKCAVDAMFNLQESCQFRQFISVLHTLTGAIRSNINTSVVYTKEFAETFASLIIMLNPVAPHLSEQLWLHFSQCVINPLRNDESSKYKTGMQAADQPWPIPDENYKVTSERKNNKRHKKK